ncbi:MAG: sigma-70 family RNA polymerase sigma factor [Solirubrobacterales bacterium]|nr:sigma-70 family RNA polymerase sigma factor [Solirubrobacterales bacterium]
MSPEAVDDTLARERGRGDARALARIFHTYHQPLYRYCLSILGNPQDAEDALQETMVKVLRGLPGEKREIALKPWLYRIAHNESIDQLRRRREYDSLDDGEVAAEGAGVTEQVETRQRLRQLIADLGVLPERQRGALVMREAGGLDFDEIALALATTPAVARQTLYEARLGLREMAAGRDMTCTAVTKALSDGDRRVWRRRDLRAHLRGCDECQQFAGEMDSRRHDLAAISPLPAVAAAAILHGLIDAGAGVGAAGATGVVGTSGGFGGLIGATTAKSIGTATLLKGAVAVGVVAAIGVGAADKGGLIHFSHDQPAPARRSDGVTGDHSQSGDGALPSLGAANASAADRGDAGVPSPGHGSIGVERHRPVGRARAATAVPSDGAAVQRTESAPEEPVVSKSVDATVSPSPGKSAVEPPTGRSEDQPAAEQPFHPTHPTHPTHPAKSQKPVKPPKADGSAKQEKPEKATKPEKSDAHGKKGQVAPDKPLLLPLGQQGRKTDPVVGGWERVARLSELPSFANRPQAGHFSDRRGKITVKNQGSDREPETRSC